MNLLDSIYHMFRQPGDDSPLTEDEQLRLAKITAECVRRHEAWDVFVQYHENAGWAKEEAQAKKEANAYLPPEAVEYMRGEIQRRLGRESLRKALEQANEQAFKVVPTEAVGNGDDGAADLGGPANHTETNS